MKMPTLIVLGYALACLGCTLPTHPLTFSVSSREELNSRYINQLKVSGYSIVSEFGERRIFVKTASYEKLKGKRAFYLAAIQFESARRLDGTIDLRVTEGLWLNLDDSFKPAGAPNSAVSELLRSF